MTMYSIPRCRIAVFALTLFISAAFYMPVVRGGDDSDSKSKQIKGNELRDWKKRYRNYYSSSDVNLAVNASKNKRTLMEYFVRLLYQGSEAGTKRSRRRKLVNRELSAKNIADSYKLLGRDLNDIQTFWKRVTNAKNPQKYQDVKAIYKMFRKTPGYRQMVFYYSDQGTYKGIKVTLGEVVSVIKACRGDEEHIGFYFSKRVNEKLPPKKCVEALKERLKLEKQRKTEEKQQKEAGEKSSSEKKEEKKDVGKENKQTEKAGKTGKEKDDTKNKATQKTKEKPVDDVLVTD